MTAQVTAGQPVTLLAQFFDFEGGSLTDLDATPSIGIVNIGTAAVALAATTTGVTHPGTGSYGYTWTPSTALAAGSYLATWSGLKTGAAVTATETVTVIAPASSENANTGAAGVWYCTREDVKGALDSKETARNNRQVDRAIEAASRSIEKLCHRKFFPTVATRHWDWPNAQGGKPWRLWLDDNELISLTTLSSGGTTIAAADYFLEPVRTGPPYTRLEVDLASSASFGGGSTHQRDISVTGLFGYRNDETLVADVDEAMTASETGLDVTSAADIGVGSLLRIGSERLIVTGKAMKDTGVNVTNALTASQADVALTLSTLTAAPAIDEVILIDSERMLVVDLAGSVATVKRAWDGSVLAAHTTNADIYAPRTLTVARGALGTTAATMSAGDDVYRWDPPGPVRQLCIAEALMTVQMETTAYSQTKRSGEGDRRLSNAGLIDLRDQVYASHGRKARSRAV